MDCPCKARRDWAILGKARQGFLFMNHRTWRGVDRLGDDDGG